MAKLYREQAVTDVGGTIEAYEGNAGQVLKGMGKLATDFAKEVEAEYETSQRLYENSMNNLASQSMQDIYTTHQDNPQKLQEEFAKLDKDLFDNIPDEETKLKFKSEFILKSGSYINNARNNQKRIQEAQLRQSREQSLIDYTNLRETALANMMSGIATADDIVNFNMASENIKSLLGSRKANGLYEFTPSQQETFRKGLDKSIADGFYNSMYSMGYDEIDENLQRLHKDNYTVSYFDDEGNKREINLKDMVKPETYRDIKNKSFKVMEEVRKSEYFTEQRDFTQNPTQEGFDRLKQLDPKMSQKTEDNLLDILDSVVDEKAETTVEGEEKAKEWLNELPQKIMSADPNNTDFLGDVAGYIKKLHDLNKNKVDGKAVLSSEDFDDFSNLAYELVSDNPFAEKVYGIFGKPNIFQKKLSFLGDNKVATINNIGRFATRDAVKVLLNGELSKEERVEQARKIYEDAKIRAIQHRYDYIDFTNVKEGSIVWSEKLNRSFKFNGYTSDDILVEINPRFGAVR
jgi:hypothetical protein